MMCGPGILWILVGDIIMPGTPIPATVVTELQRQMNHEWTAAHAYEALAVWCEFHTLTGFAEFFHKQAEEEREHAEKFMDHLADRGVMPVIAAIPAPQTDFASLLEVAKKAQTMEQVNTKGVYAVYEAAEKAHDLPAKVMLAWFVNEQVEEEAWTDELVSRVETANCAGAIAELDRHIIKYLVKE